MTRIDSDAQEIAEDTGDATEVVREPVNPLADGEWGWTRAHRVGIGILLVMTLAWLSVQYMRRPYRLGDAAAVRHGSVPELEIALDPNTADWESLSRVPGVGEKTARAIVAYRESHAVDGGIVFQAADDLDHVPGVGKKTVEQIRGYMRFAEEVGESPHGLTPPEPVATTQEEER